MKDEIDYSEGFAQGRKLRPGGERMARRFERAFAPGAPPPSASQAYARGYADGVRSAKRERRKSKICALFGR